MTDSMMSNQSITLKTATVSTALGAGGTFQIYETGIVLSKTSVVFRNKVQKERFQLDIATDGTCTIIKRGLTQGQTKVEDNALRKEWSNGAEGYITLLASDVIDMDNEGGVQKPKGEYEYEGNVQFNAELESIGQFIASGKSRPQPSFATEQIRDAVYTSPIDGDACKVAGNYCQYNGTTQQREYFGISTPVPQSSESVQGKIQLATDAEVLAGTENTKAITSKKLQDKINANVPSSFIIPSDYPLGEAITDITKSCLFKETAPTFAQATQAQNIGNVAGNTRVSFPAIGTGVAGNSLKLSLAKVLNPTAFLRVRLETDNAGNPSGTLVDTNATKDIDPATLTTSLADTTVLMGATVANAHGVTLNVNETSQTVYKGVKFTLTQQVGAVSVDKVAGCTATKAYLYDLAGNLLTSATFSTNTATLNYSGLVNGTSYYIMAGSDGSSYTSVKQTGASAYPYTAGRLNFIGGKEYIASHTSNASLGTPQSYTFVTGNVSISFTPQKDIYIKNINIGYDTGDVMSIMQGATLMETSSAYGVFSGNTKLSAGVTYTVGARLWVGGTANWNTVFTTGTDGYITYNSYSSIGGKYPLTTSFVLKIDSNTTDINNITSISTNDTILIPSGQKVHTVVSAVGDVVNASNYYKIGCNSVDTTTRRASHWNGVSWSIISELVTIDSSGQTLSPTSTEPISRGYRIYTNKASYLTSVTKTASSSATRVRLLADGGTTLATATFVGNIATFTPYLLTTGTYYRVEADNNGANYTFAYNNSSTSFPYAGTNITYNTGSNGGSSQAFACNIASISTTEYTLPFPYVSSTLFHNTVLSLTDSDFSYKVALYGISTALASIGTYPKLTVFGASDNFTGMTEGGTQYLGPTPGGIQSSAGTNSFVVGKARNATKLRVKDLIS